MRAPAAGGNGEPEDVMRLPYHLGGTTRPGPPLLGGPIPPDPPWLDTDEWLTLADRVSVFHQPLDDLRGAKGPGRGDGAFRAARADRAKGGGGRPRGPGGAPRR